MACRGDIGDGGTSSGMRERSSSVATSLLQTPSGPEGPFFAPGAAGTAR